MVVEDLPSAILWRKRWRQCRMNVWNVTLIFLAVMIAFMLVSLSSACLSQESMAFIRSVAPSFWLLIFMHHVETVRCTFLSSTPQLWSLWCICNVWNLHLVQIKHEFTLSHALCRFQWNSITYWCLALCSLIFLETHMDCLQLIQWHPSYLCTIWSWLNQCSQGWLHLKAWSNWWRPCILSLEISCSSQFAMIMSSGCHSPFH